MPKINYPAILSEPMSADEIKAREEWAYDISRGEMPRAYAVLRRLHLPVPEQYCRSDRLIQQYNILPEDREALLAELLGDRK